MNSDTNGLPTHSMPRASRQIPSGVYRLSNCAHTRLLTRLPSAAISNTVRRLAKLSARMSLRPSGRDGASIRKDQIFGGNADLAFRGHQCELSGARRLDAKPESPIANVCVTSGIDDHVVCHAR